MISMEKNRGTLAAIIILLSIILLPVSAQDFEDGTFISAKRAIRQQAIGVAKQIEIYITLNPDKTIKDLQNDSYFQSIAVQPVGKTGYTAVTDYSTLTCRFHTNPKVVDLELEKLAEKLPGFWSVMSTTRGE